MFLRFRTLQKLFDTACQFSNIIVDIACQFSHANSMLAPKWGILPRSGSFFSSLETAKLLTRLPILGL